MSTTAGSMYATSAIYAIVNRQTCDMYIGSAVRLNRRWSEHRRALCRNLHHSAPLQNAVKKHGFDSFDLEIVEFVKDKCQLITREQFWINFFKPKYNARKIANSPLGTKHSAETRAKMSASAKLRGFTEEHKKNISLAKRGVPMSEEQKALRSRAGKGKVLSEETKAKLSVALKGNRNWAGKQVKEVDL